MSTVASPSFCPVATDSGWRVWGQEPAARSFQRAAISGPRHAYVLAGPDHIGKRLLAQEFALALNCPAVSETGVPCRVCSICQRIERGVHPDVSIFNLDRQARVESGTGKNTSLTIDTVRAIGHDLALRPSEAPWRVMIVDDMETMRETAQEALLKTLEEPPAAAVLLLLTSDIENLLETVLSRCVVVNLPVSPARAIDEALVAAGVAPAEASELALLARGLPGWAFAAANDATLRAGRQEMRDNARAWLAGDGYTRMVRAIKLADGFGQNRDEVVDSLVAVMLEWRHLLYQSVGLADDLDIQPGPPALYPAATLVRAVDSVRACLADLDANVRPRLACETMVLQWPTAQ